MKLNKEDLHLEFAGDYLFATTHEMLIMVCLEPANRGTDLAVYRFKYDEPTEHYLLKPKLNLNCSLIQLLCEEWNRYSSTINDYLRNIT
jgi:hypothetical protein